MAFHGLPPALAIQSNRSKHKTILKKFKSETILKIPGHIALECVDVWFQDEARFGQQNTTTRLWARKGSRPRATKQQQFEYAHIFGSVCPSRGTGEAIVVPFLSKDAMLQHLAQISAITEPGRHAVVIMDGAGWHTDEMADPFPNISIVKLPPYSPELNSIEQVWSWMRQHHLANIAFDNYNDIVDRVCEAWNSFLSCSKRVAKTCMRDWTDLIN